MKENIHIHLDPMGGISGDMFISAMIDADSSFKKLAKNISKKIIKDIEIIITKSSINHISGTKFAVKLISRAHNHHRSFNDIKKLIEKSYLDKEVKDISINIFNELAKAESQVHGVSIDKVSFHEIGAWDSIVDNIVAAAIINRLDTIIKLLGHVVQSQLEKERLKQIMVCFLFLLQQHLYCLKIFL